MKSIGVNHFVNEYPLLNWDTCPELNKFMFSYRANNNQEKKLIEGNPILIDIFILE